MPPMGGSEILQLGLKKHTNVSLFDNINILLSTPNINMLNLDKKNILWQHLNYSDESLSSLHNKNFLKNIDSFIYVSNWQYEKFRYFHGVPVENAKIIKNAIEPIEFIEKPKGEKIKLIYASTPFRGLDVLLDAFELLNRDDVELDIYSSTLMYGSAYAKHHHGIWDHLFEKAKKMKNVNYLGYATNKDVHKAMQNSHIFAYPSTFEETCCLAMVEAGAAGCRILSTNIGALFETGSEYAKLLPIQSDKDILAKMYANLLNEEIDNYWNLENQNKLKEQSDFYNKYYSWDLRSKEWNILFDQLSSS
jgi:glycosyltransferase involved in cell wall biosynthesis